MRDIWGKKKKERVRVNFLEARTAVHHPVQNTSTWFPPGRTSMIQRLGLSGVEEDIYTVYHIGIHD